MDLTAALFRTDRASAARGLGCVLSGAAPGRRAGVCGVRGTCLVRSGPVLASLHAARAKGAPHLTLAACAEVGTAC